MNDHGHPQKRMCNKYGCDGRMRPTEELSVHPGHRIYSCIVCGNRTPWVDEPDMDGSFAELHNLPGKGHSGLSMMSDPYLYPPKPPVTSSRRTK